MSNKRILVTGALGNVGSEVVKHLLKNKVDILLADINEDRAKEMFGDVPFVKLDFTDYNTYEESLEGVNKVFLLRPPAIANVKKHMTPFIELSAEKRIEQMVFLSLQGVENNKITPHYKIEKSILENNINYTFLRPSFYMQNLATTHREDIQYDDEICVPAGNGKTSFIDVRDIGSVGAKVLMEDGHLNKAYELTGNDSLTYFEVADIFTEVLGRKIEYTKPSVFKFFRKMRKRKVKIPFILIMIGLYSVSRFNKAGGVTGEVEQLLNRPPISFKQFVEDYKDIWMR